MNRNRCFATGALVTMASVVAASCVFGSSAPGPCGGDDCSYGECCIESCGGVDPSDACVEPPMACDDIWAPVCGCNGLTYASACEAHAACVAVSHEGACVTASCNSAVCLPGQCCLESCGGVDAADACIEPPDACTEIYAPVCGCDGVTYVSSCEAHRACAAIDRAGTCESMSG